MKAFGEIKKGKLILNNKQQFQDQLVALEGKNVVIKIVERGNNRTKDQNSLFWQWVDIISNETGYTKEETKELIQYKFLQRERLNEEGYTETYLKGTSTLSKKEFTDFMNEVSYWSNNTLSISLPTYE
jgi:L-cysteine desulfidase